MSLTTEENVEVNQERTKLFIGTTQKVEKRAKDFAANKRSYVFRVLRKTKEGNETVKSFYAYGVPN